MLALTLYDFIVLRHPSTYPRYVEIKRAAAYRQAIYRLFALQVPKGLPKVSGGTIKITSTIARLTVGLSSPSKTKVTEAVNKLYETLDTSAKIPIINPATEQNPFTETTSYKQEKAIDEFSKALYDLINQLVPLVDRETLVGNMQQIIIDLTQEEASALTNSELGALDSAGASIREDQILPDQGYFTRKVTEGTSPHSMPSFTGADMNIVVMTPHVITLLMNIIVMSYSLHATVTGVKPLGRSSPKGFAHGDRTIAGSIIAVVAGQDALMPLQPALYTEDTESISETHDLYRPFLLPDQLPLFDVVLTFQNEYGDASAIAIFGIKVTDVGQVISMSDSQLEVQYTYQALDVQPMRAIRTRGEDGGSVIEVSNNEYLLIRNRVLKGMGMNRSPFEVTAMYNEMTDIFSQIDLMQKQKIRNDQNAYADEHDIKPTPETAGLVGDGSSTIKSNTLIPNPMTTLPADAVPISSSDAKRIEKTAQTIAGELDKSETPTNDGFKLDDFEDRSPIALEKKIEQFASDKPNGFPNNIPIDPTNWENLEIYESGDSYYFPGLSEEGLATATSADLYKMEQTAKNRAIANANKYMQLAKGKDADVYTLSSYSDVVMPPDNKKIAIRVSIKKSKFE